VIAIKQDKVLMNIQTKNEKGTKGTDVDE